MKKKLGPFLAKLLQSACNQYQEFSNATDHSLFDKGRKTGSCINLWSACNHGVMGYQTPNIDHVA